MDIFRFETHVPDVYVKESRDFQMLLRLLTFAMSGTKNNAESLKYLNDPETIPGNLLELLKTKVGFYTKKNFTDYELRIILSSFCEAVRNKGSIRGIILSIILFYEAKRLNTSAYIEVTHDTGDPDTEYQVRIGLNVEEVDFTLLTEVLRYILPAGYDLVIFFYKGSNWIQKYSYSHEVYWVCPVGDERTIIAGSQTQELKEGVNMIDQTRLEDRSYIRWSGQIGHQGGWFLTDYIPVEEGESYYFNGAIARKGNVSSDGYAPYMSCYDGKLNHIALDLNDAISEGKLVEAGSTKPLICRPLTIPEDKGIRFIRLSGFTSSGYAWMSKNDTPPPEYEVIGDYMFGRVDTSQIGIDEQQV